MSPHRERVLHGNVSSEHLVQLFDEPESLVAAVADFLLEGWRRGDELLVVARSVNWALTAAELDARGCRVAEATASGQLVALDATTTLATFMVNGDPHVARFKSSVGALVEQMSARGSGLTAYGEMVDVLVAQGNFAAADELEAMWNELIERCSLRLMCGYSSAHFGDERNAKHLRAICAAHHRSTAAPADLLGSWLLANRRSAYVTH